MNQDQILDFNIVQSSVEHIKKIHDSKNEKSEKKKSVAAALGAFRSAAPIDLLQKYSEILTKAFMTIKYCPFQETVPVSLQVCLTMSQKILETFEGIDKKDLNQEKIASTVSTMTFVK